MENSAHPDIAVTVFGNCQSRPIAECLAAMIPSADVRVGFSKELKKDSHLGADLIHSTDLVIVQTCMLRVVQRLMKESNSTANIVVAPTIYFNGFHPDLVYAQYDTGYVTGAMGQYNSAITLFAWLNELDVSQTLKLFSGEVYDLLGYPERLPAAKAQLLADAQELGMDLAPEMERWDRAATPFMYSVNHPRIGLIAGLARAIAAKAKLDPVRRYPEEFLLDRLASKAVWPVYPELGERFNMVGEYVFKLGQSGRGGHVVDALDLPTFVERSFEAYSKFDRAKVRCTRFEDPRYEQLIARARRAGAGGRARHPYRGLPDHQFWNKAVAGVAPPALDPVVGAGFTLERETRIATGGSCFAQHIAKALQRSGYRYHVAETGDHLPAEIAAEQQYGVYSARYGNLYTPAQLLQLVERAEGEFAPQDSAWLRPDGGYADPFRPEIQPRGFASVEALEASRAEHLAAVRQMWRDLDVFIFTLGLTEAWRAKADGAVFPIAPGVAAGEMDFDRYEFHNYTVEETTEAMRCFVERLRAINPTARIILTVSPVPLAATYEPRHVLVATTYSKSVLRVAAETIAREFDHVEYFPSYEIITGSYNRGAYFEADLRSVTEEGVAHVMDRFLAKYTDQPANDPAAPVTAPSVARSLEPVAGALNREVAEGQAIFCEEELLARVD